MKSVLIVIYHKQHTTVTKHCCHFSRLSELFQLVTSFNINFLFFSSNEVGSFSTRDLPHSAVLPSLLCCRHLGVTSALALYQAESTCGFSWKHGLITEDFAFPTHISNVSTGHKCSNYKSLNINDKGYYTSSLLENSPTKHLCI